MRPGLPSGTVTFLFTDVEGSTKLLHALGAEAYADALAEHRRTLRDALTRHGGVEVDTQGDAFFVAFPTAPGALAAATEATAALSGGPIKVRIGLHTGSPIVTAEGYVGPDVHRAARIAAAGHGGQILVSAATAQLVNGAELRDLGLHRLKDLAAPERIYQLGAGEHPPLKTISNTNLPTPVSSFIGREHELAGIIDRLRAVARLVTLTGPGGTGKTRLALAAGAALVTEFAGGVFWVPLAAIEDPELVLPEIVRVVGAPDDLASHIGDRDMLLVLDNLEQVIAVGPMMAALLEGCPNLRLLVTSRELLRVRGESEFAVPPLGDTDAESLFVARAGITDDAVRELCRRLDNLPLAVELAAARARTLTPEQMLARLSTRLDLFRGGRDAEDRQRTLRRTIEWSHELLAVNERELFARLAVFRGGWSLDAAEEVAGAGIDSLESLVDKSLVLRADDRFRMLETIRSFADERLAELADADDLRTKHLAFFTDLAERWYADRFASESRWLPLVEVETDNLRTALDWAAVHDASAEVRLIGALAPLWALGARGAETRSRLTSALARHDTRDAIRARAMTHLGEMEDDTAAIGESIEIWRELSDAEGEAVALEAMGWAYDAVGDYGAAQGAYEASLEVRRVAGSPDARGLSSRAGICHVLVAHGDTARAHEVATELLGLAREHHAALMEELALHFIADCALLDEDWTEAETRYRRALEYARDHDLLGRSTDEVLGIAMARAGADDPIGAVRLAVATRTKQAEIGKGIDAWWTGMQERLLGPARAALSPEDLRAAEDEAGAVGFDHMVEELLAPEGARA